MIILRAIWTSFEHVQMALAFVQTLCYCLEILHPSIPRHWFQELHCEICKKAKILLMKVLLGRKIYYYSISLFYKSICKFGGVWCKLTSQYGPAGLD